MSFRSRSRTTQSLVPRRRSLSNSRTPSVINSPLYYNGNSGYSSSLSSAASRPLTTPSYYTQPSSVNTSAYQSPYSNIYGSRESLYSHSPRNGFYYSNGKSYNSNTANKTNSITGNLNYKNTSSPPVGAYDKWYLNNSPSSSSSSYGGHGGSTSSDRYISPYSTFDNGITTAGLNLNLSSGKCYSSPSYLSTNSNTNSSKKRDYTPQNTNLVKSKSLSTSNTNVNSYTPSSNSKVSVGTDSPSAIVARSQSLRDQERKSRSRNRNRNAAVRSLSASSEKSEGYESGSEKASRSRLGSISSLADSEQSDGKASGKESSENGELIDYKLLWEALKVENDKLKQQLKKRDDELSTAKTAIDRLTNATTKNSLSELEKRERRAMERKLSEMEEELKLLQKLKTENERLRAENRALTRVVSKLTTSAQNQLHNKK